MPHGSGAGALGERDRAFERVEDLRRGDLGGRARQQVAAVQPARGKHQALAVQLLEQLGDRGRAPGGSRRRAARP